MEADVAAECEAIADRLDDLGRKTLTLGSLFGPDRLAGRSEVIGDERVYAAGLVMEIAADIGHSCVALMRAGYAYSAQALTRHLIECEYLVAAFAQDPEAAREWLNADKDARRRYWAPYNVRKRLPGMFRDTEYASHSDTAHPTAWSMVWLPSHSAVPAESGWEEVALHLRRFSKRCDEVIRVLGVEAAVAVDKAT